MLLKHLEPYNLCLRILQIILLVLVKKLNQGHLKRIFNSNILRNLEFAIFDFTEYKTHALRARFPCSSLMRTKQNQIYLLWFTSFTGLCKFYENQHQDFFSPIIDTDTDHFTLSENNFRLTLFRMGGEGGKKVSRISFSPVTSINVEINPQNFPSVGFNSFGALV